MRPHKFAVLLLLAFFIGLGDGNASHHKPNFKNLDSLALLLKGFDATEANDHKRAIDLYSRVVNAAVLSANHLSSAHRARGDAYFQTGNPELAIQDYTRALQLNPHNAAAYINRGNVHTRQTRFGAALDDLNNAIILAPHDALAFQNRGNIHFFSGRFNKASFDYRRSLGLEPSDQFSAIWLYLARSRAGGNGRSDLVSQSKDWNLVKWPGPVVSLYLDQISASELIEIAHGRTRKEQKEIVSEAYFYGGEYHLLRYDSEAATKMFRQVIQQGVQNLVEYTGAMVELKRLDR